MDELILTSYSWIDSNGIEFVSDEEYYESLEENDTING